MIKLKLILIALFIGLLPVQVNNVGSSPSATETLPFFPSRGSLSLTPAVSPALLSYQELITSRGQSLDNQGLLLETLDGGQVIASHNADRSYNPASVIKLATSLAALVRFGPDYRMRTALYADGTLDQASRTLDGNLVVDGDGDPLFDLNNAQLLAQNVARVGVSHVTGDLVIKGAFSINRSASPANSAQRMLAALKGAGVKIKGGVQFGTGRGGTALLVTHESGTPLRQVLLYQNAHSDNPIAERIGDAIGGPQALTEFLIMVVGVAPGEVYISRTSGLDYNRLSPRGTVKLMRRLMEVLEAYNLKPEDIMPVAGVDSGTLATRFRGAEWHGAIIGKTGSLPGTDGGVSTLAGVAYTQKHGPVLYAIYNTGGDVRQYRHWQDELLENVVRESGGPAVGARVANGLNQEIRMEPLVHAGGR